MTHDNPQAQNSAVGRNLKGTEMPEHNFEVGQWVECVDGVDGIEKGKFYRIIEITGEFYLVMTNKDYAIGYEANCFKPAIPEVGSRWITDGGHDFVILKADEENILYREVSDSDWVVCRPRDFFDCCKPKPKTTVRYLNLYENHMRLQHCKDRNDARARRSEKGYLATIKVETDGAGKNTTTQVDLEWE